MQTGSSEALICWKSRKTTYVPIWDRMEGAWLWTLYNVGYWGFGLVVCSDLHVSQWSDLGRVDDLLSFAHSTLHTIQPAAVVVTGINTFVRRVFIVNFFVVKVNGLTV